MALSEAKKILALAAITFLLGITGFYVTTLLPRLTQGDLSVSDYTATLYPNGSLIEEYTYSVKTSGEYRMLFRIWDASLSLDRLNTPQFILKDVQNPAGSIAYLKDYQGNVWVQPP